MTKAFLDADQIRAATFVRHVEIHDTLGSTNDRAAELAREAAIELPALVVARRQTAGRGRGHKTWWAAEGALTFSLLLEPAALGVGTASWPQLSLATAVAVCDALQPAAPGAKLGVKWPNDVLLDGRKVSGILVESPGGPLPAKDRLIVGVGVNINNSFLHATPEECPKATALCDVMGRPYALQVILQAVLLHFAERIGQVSASDPRLSLAWQRLNSLTGRNVAVEIGSRRIDGECIEIAADGALVVDTARGRQRLFSGSVLYI